MHIHILGICGTFMGGIAMLARELGYKVSGTDANVYPPMSTQLEAAGIRLCEGYLPEHLTEDVDVVVVGNVMSRGNPMVEHVLNQQIPYVSGPQWLEEHIINKRWVLAVAGTHGKTTTSSMIAWLLEHAGLNPGFLIGGVPLDFGVSARLGADPFFVVEADEYDTAFFDKRSKFVHYHPRTLVLNNLEFDHADIFPDIDAIKRQFHHLVRTVPGAGLIISNRNDVELDDVLGMGCWTPIEGVATRLADAANWTAEKQVADGSRFLVLHDGESQGEVNWQQLGNHNVHNALAAIAAARHAGVPVAEAIRGLGAFKGVKRRMELCGEVNGIAVYDDFAHHPTEIETTLSGLRARLDKRRILAVLELRSNTMRMGLHQVELADSLKQADHVWLRRPDNLGWDLAAAVAEMGDRARVHDDVDSIVTEVSEAARPGDAVLVMSNGGFEGIHGRLLDVLAG